MLATISLKQRSDAAFTLVQVSLVIAGLVLALGFIKVLAGQVDEGLVSATPSAAVTDSAVVADAEAAAMAPAAPAQAESDAGLVVLSLRMQGALDYVKRRYHVSPEALLPVFAAAQLIAQERRLDPLLVIAVIGVESGFNPFAESATGAQGLMQIIPRWHRDKLPEGAGERPLLDPLINIKVGVQFLEEAIRRNGGLVAGLQYYAGAADSDDEGYANKVLAEKERLEQAARRIARASA